MGKVTKSKTPPRKRVEPKLGRYTAAIKSFLEKRPGATVKAMAASRGSTPLVLIYKVMEKMFAILSVRNEEFVILKCDPMLAQALREEYKGVGHRSHLDRRFWISVDLDADVPAQEVKRLINHSYGLVCAGLTKKQQEKLATRKT